MRHPSFTILACLALAPAVVAAEPPKKVEPRTAISVADRKDVAPVTLARIRTTLLADAPIGERSDGIFCQAKGQFILAAKVREPVERALLRGFRSELNKAGYPNPYESQSTFEDKPRTETDFQVGAQIRKLQANLCVHGKESTGASYVEVKWELYYKKAKKVVFETVTEGSYSSNMQAETISFYDWFERAFAVATRNMLAEAQFGDILAGAVPLPPAVETAAAPGGAAAAGAPLLRLAAAPSLQGGVAQNVTMLRAAVVTINNGKGTGSGFFVSPDGYLITNQHVVGDVTFVKVKIATGRELVGEVLKSDAKRDVALIKTEPIGAATLGIRTTEANVGDEVYVIGSPLGEKFSGTLTRGILSGYRTLNEQRFLQSDAAILPGNSGGPLLDASGKVVGITKAGTFVGNLNLFIPIGEAVTALSLEVKE